MTKKKMLDIRLIESDAFPFEFLSQIGERESWRKEAVIVPLATLMPPPPWFAGLGGAVALPAGVGLAVAPTTS